MKKNSGFTLLETMVALLIFMIGTVGVLQLLLISQVQINLAASQVTSYLTASSKLAELRAGGEAKLSQWKDENSFHQATGQEADNCLCKGWYSNVTALSIGDERFYRVEFVVVGLTGQEQKFVTYLADMGPPATGEGVLPIMEQPIKLFQRE